MYSKHLIVIFLLFTSFSFAQTKILRASLSTAPQTARVGDFTVQQSIGHMGIIGAVNHQQHTILTGFLLPQATNLIGPMPEINWAVYPNPFTTHINIEFSTQISGLLTLSLYDVTGQLVFQESFEAKQKQQININHLSKAEYLAHFTVSGHAFTTQILKK